MKQTASAVTPKLIHTMLGKLGMQDEEYRAILREKFGKNSSNELNPAQKTLLINHLRGLLNGYKIMPFKGSNNTVVTASDKPQVQLIYTLWEEMADKGIIRHRKGLGRFIRNMTGIDGVEWLPPEQLQKVINALMAIKRRASK